MMGLVVISVLVFKMALVVSLNTDYPLHTPISQSMEPTLNIGDLLIAEGVNNFEGINADSRNGDIIIFRHPQRPYTPSPSPFDFFITDPGEFVVHRAIEKKYDGEPYLVTKGDNELTNPHEDPWKVREDMIIGKVVWRIPFLGYIKIFLDTPLGMIITVILFFILILLDFFSEQKEE